MSEWSRGTRILFWCLAALVALGVAFGVYDNFRKTQIIDVQRAQNVSLSDALTQAQSQLIENGVQPNTQSPDEISDQAAPELAVLPGSPGERGPQGLPGVRGQAGPKGEPGEDGEPGAAGAIGPVGAAGKDSSVPGPAGAAGRPGADSTVAGPQGPAGESVVGPAGPAGAPGAPGTNGVDGLNGADGRSVESISCALTDMGTALIFTDQNGAEISRVQSLCTP